MNGIWAKSQSHRGFWLLSSAYEKKPTSRNASVLGRPRDDREENITSPCFSQETPIWSFSAKCTSSNKRINSGLLTFTFCWFCWWCSHFQAFFSKRLVNSFSLSGFGWFFFSSSWLDWFFRFSCSLYISGLLRGQAASSCTILTYWVLQDIRHSTWQGFENKVWNWSWQWGVAGCWGWLCMRCKTSRLQSSFLQGIGMPNQGCSALAPMPTTPFSPLLLSSSLPLKKSNINGFCKAEGLVWVFFPPSWHRKTVQVDAMKGCRDAAKIRNKGSAGFPGQIGL